MVEEIKKIKVLEIGAGKDCYANKGDEEVIHLDRVRLPHVEVVCDVNKEKLPFNADSFDSIYMDNVLHLLDDTIKIVEECYRVLKPEGKLIITVPHYSSFNAYRDLLVKHHFTRFSMDYFKKDNNLNFYSNARFKVKYELKPSGIGKFLPSFIRDKLCFFINGLIDEICFEMVTEK